MPAMPALGNYRPIPGQVDIPLPPNDLTREALSRASNLLVPYKERFGIKPVGAPASPGVPEAGLSPAMDSRLYEAIHPQTFTQVLDTIMQLVTGRPIPKYQGGTENVEETGPAILHKGEAVVPASQNPSNPANYQIPTTFTGAVEAATNPFKQRNEMAEAEALRKQAGVTYNPNKGVITQPGGIGGALAEAGWLGTRPGEAPEGYGIPKPGAGVSQETAPAHTAPTGTEGPTPAPRTREEKMQLPPLPENIGWTTTPYDKGIQYQLGAEPGTPEYGTPVTRPIPYQSPESVELAARERWAQPGYAEKMGTPNLTYNQYTGRAEGTLGVSPGYQRSYYEAHPEEKAMQDWYDLNRPSQDQLSREKMEMDRLDVMSRDRNVPKSARLAAAQRLNTMIEGMAARDVALKKGTMEIMGKGIEQGGKGAEEAERLAHADWLRQQPELERWKTESTNAAHMAAVMAQVQGQLDVANINAEVKNDMMNEVSRLYQTAVNEGKYTGVPANLNEIARNVIRTRRAWGQIDDQTWSKLPPEWTKSRMVNLYGKDEKGKTRQFLNIPEERVPEIMQKYPNLTTTQPRA